MLATRTLVIGERAAGDPLGAVLATSPPPEPDLPGRPALGFPPAPRGARADRSS
ncbi:hypothetical protein [Streptomyces sp. 1222.5]|uniref:hypothetical protein n=1 Tax=Streptomyces sp. 1222.5 TaxID=1881026 RepID=UPI003D708FD2